MDISFKDVCMSFENKKVLDSLSCQFKSGELTLLKGTSGIGKTTLLNLITGVLKPQKGNIEIPKGLKIREVFQEDRLLENMTVNANLNLVLDKKLSPSEVSEYLQKLSIDALPSQKVRDLSGGMKRRVAVLRAVLTLPDVLLLDEAFSGMDENNAKRTLEFIMENMRGKTIIASTHREEIFSKYPHNIVTL